MNGRGHGESCNFRNAVISASPLDIFQAVNDKKCKDCRREGLSQKIDIAGKTASWFEDEEGEGRVRIVAPAQMAIIRTCS